MANPTDRSPRARVTRRAFLATGTAAGAAALVIGFRWEPASRAQEPPAKAKEPPNPFDAWVRIAADGAVTLVLAKSEMGQGVMTSLPMILAEELDVDWANVRVEQAVSNPAIYQHSTGGSTAVRTYWTPLRQAGAAAREMLVQAAAARWQLEPSACRAERGAVVHAASGRSLTYAELVADAAKRPIPDFATVPLKKPDQFRIVGKGGARVDVPAKVDGSARFGLDVRVPGMLRAVIARCPVPGGKAKRFDAARAKGVAGVRHVVEIPPVPAAHAPGGIAVVADTTWAAVKGREALGVEWDLGPNRAESSAALRAQFEQLVKREGKVVRSDGDAPGVLASAARKVEAVYELPFLSHAQMEPMNCTADVRADRAELWAATQDSGWLKTDVAALLQLPPEKVTVHTTFLGGGFGRRAHSDYAAEAAQVSKAVAAPVQVVWTREDDMRHGFYRPMSVHLMRAALDAQGRPAAWFHRMASTSIAVQWGAMFGGAPAEASEIGGAVNLAYAVPNMRMEYAQAVSAVPVMWWRSVEHSMTAFAVESFVDELAAAAGADPLAFRLGLLAEPRLVKDPFDPEHVLDTRRLRGVLELAASKAGWGAPLPKGRGRGIAGHFSFYSYAAHVIEVSVDAKGTLGVHRIVGAVDCGRVVNPDGVAAQVESAVTVGLSAALKGAITIAGGAVEQSNFDDYEVLRIHETPVVETHIVPSEAAPTGIGEPGLPPVAPALANAIFAATGKRLRRLPLGTSPMV